jgi:hypothetical protein
MSINYNALKNEITNNPKSILDLGWDKTDVWIANTLNTPGISGEAIADASNVDMNTIMSAFDADEVAGLSTNQSVLLSGLVARNGLNPANGLNTIRAIFGVATTTRANLEALQNREASRSEILFGYGISVSLLDVHLARRL